jgi:hypothetical protein
MIRSTALLAALLIAVPAFASAEPARRNHHRHPHPPQRSQPLIACTVLGCAAVPPGCGSVPGRSFTGQPTGHDIVVCPPGVAPFR